MPMRPWRVILYSAAVFLSVAIIGLLSPPLPALTPASMAQGQTSSLQHEGAGYVLYAPAGATPDRPMTLLVAMYGMGGNAESFAESLKPMADRNGWLLLVPSFTYGDWKQVDAVRSDDRQQLPSLRAIIDALPQETGFQVRERVLLYGFSRGAQAAHRFALMYNHKVLASASMAAGSYTLPISSTVIAGEQSLKYPLGVGDLASYCGEQFVAEDVSHVRFWVGVGAMDNNPDDVPRPWDRYLGSDRVARARSFAAGMSNLVGAQVQLDIIPGLEHAESDESRARAEAFLLQSEQEYLRGL